MEFYYVYKYLAHAGKDGYVQPFTLRERRLHIEEAKRTLGTRVPWICDSMANDLKHALGDAPTSEIVVDPNGRIARRRAWGKIDALRRDLEELAGPVENPTRAEDLDLKTTPRPEVAASGVVKKLNRPGGMKPLRIEPVIEKDALPFYMKLRPQGDRSLLRRGKGKLYLEFRPDPIYDVHWNNLTDPIHIEVEPPEGATATPRSADGPTVEEPADIDPREFLLDIDARDTRKPLHLAVRYFACNEEAGWCREIKQRYTIFLTEDVNDGYFVKLMPRHLSAVGASGIKPWSKNPRYWQYKGKPIVLAGGSDDDNLFQLPDLEDHLDQIQKVGGNYIRNTMSDRPDKGFEVYPFRKLDEGEDAGKYDLDRWNGEYWTRFNNMLRWTEARDIIVQIELWDRFDYSDHRDSGRWSRHPYNPKNNVNYTAEESGLKETYTKHPGKNEQPFFYTVPKLRDNKTLLGYQVAQVDRLLSYSLEYGHVLYCMDNETSGSEEWGRFWASHVRERAAEKGVEVHMTEMWDQWNPRAEEHRRTFDHPELYSFIDISQNNHNKRQRHWDQMQWVRSYVAESPRPINTVKIYGADTGRFGNGRDGEERFWRNMLGGLASTRFHRPTSGLGLSERARAHIRSLRLLLSEFDIFRATPDAPSALLSGRAENEAYLSWNAGSQYAVYFPDGGSVALDLSGGSGEFTARWLDITKSEWRGSSRVQAGREVRLEAPGSGHWVVLLRKASGSG